LHAEANALTAQADAIGIDTYAILDDIARTYADATQDEFNAKARDAIAAAIARGNQDGGSTAAQAAPAAEPAQEPGLTAPTRADIEAQQEARDKAEREEAARQRAEDQAASKDENRKRIAQASVRAAAEFELGQDPLDSLTGQGGLMFSRTAGESGPEGVERGIAAAIEKAVQQWQVSLRNAASNPEAKEPGMATPAVLRIMGAAASRLVLPRTYLRAILDKHGDVPASVFENLPALLADPLFIIPHKDGGLRVFVEAQTAKGEPIAVGVSVGVDGRIHTVTPLHDHDGMTGQGRMARAVVTATSRIYAKNKEALAKAKASAEASPGTIPLQRNSNGNGSVITRADVVKRIAQGTKPGDPRFSFAGARAATADTHALVTAQDRLDAGEDPETVRQETGWFKGNDGRMRFEISDADALLKSDTSGAEGRRTIGQMFPLGYYGDEVGLTVGRMLHHPALFAAYPAIADIKVKMVYDLRGDDVKGSFNPSTNTITLNQNASWRDAMSTLLHEIQHGIQNIEGFAMGDSQERLAKTMPDVQAINDAKLLARFMERGESAFDARQRFMRYMGRDPNPQGVYLAERNEPNEIARMASTPLDAYKRNAGEVEARNTQARQKLTADQRRATSPSQTADVADADVIVVFNGKEMANAPMPANAAPDASATAQPLRTPASTIRAAITKAYGKLLGQLESKGLVTLTQTQEQAIEAAAQARADKTGQPLAEVRASLMGSVSNSKRVTRDVRAVLSQADKAGTDVVEVKFGTVDAALANLIQSKTRKDVGGFEHSMDSSAVRHARNEHGDARKEAARGQIAITDDDLRTAPQVIFAADRYVLGAKDRQGNDLVGYVKQMPDGTVLYVEEVRTGRKTLAFKSIRKYAATSNVDAVAKTLSLNARSDGGISIVDARSLDIKRSANGAIQGFFDPQTGQSFLVADNLTAEAAPGVLMHEVGIHMAADGSMKALFNRAAMMLKMQKGNPFIKAVQARMDAAGETSGEEAAAYIAEAYENDRANAPASVQRWLADLLAAVKAWMFKKGIMGADRLTVADIAAVARANARSMARGYVTRSNETAQQAIDRAMTAFSRDGDGDSEAARQLTETERTYGGREAYDRAKAAGKTKLTYGQWVQVRTPNFKNWFGDWEAVRARDTLQNMDAVPARLDSAFGAEFSRAKALAKAEFDKLRDKTERDGFAVVAADGRKISFSGRGFKEVAQHAADRRVLSAAANLQALFESAVPLYSAKPEDVRQQVAAFHYYGVKADFGKDGQALVLLEVVERTNGDFFYDADATTVEEVRAASSAPLADQTKSGAGGFGAARSGRLAQWASSVNPATVSKVIDPDTGEPLVVYHGTRRAFDAFTPGKPRGAIGNPAGIYFDTNKEVAEEFAMDVDGATDERSRIVEAFVRVTGDEDGQIRKRTERGRNQLEVIAFRPEQVKSAIGNNGNFDPSNPDIRFSRAVSPSQPAAWDAPVQTGFDDVIYKLQDKNIDLKRVVESITKSVGQVAAGSTTWLGADRGRAPAHQAQMLRGVTLNFVGTFDGTFQIKQSETQYPCGLQSDM
jgi:hypothetical protein